MDFITMKFALYLMKCYSSFFSYHIRKINNIKYYKIFYKNPLKLTNPESQLGILPPGRGLPTRRGALGLKSLGWCGPPGRERM